MSYGGPYRSNDRRDSCRSDDRRSRHSDHSYGHPDSPRSRFGGTRIPSSYRSSSSDRASRFRDERPRRDEGFGGRSNAFRDGGRDRRVRGSPRDQGQFRGDPMNIQLRHEEYLELFEFERCFYAPLPVVEQRLQHEVERIRFKKGITVHPPNCHPPVETFEEAFESKQRYILDTIRKQDFQVPTPIQCQSWPIVMSGHNMIGIAETGSGKTLAYLLPAIVHMLGQPELAAGEGPMALIMAPTRELAIQIFKECETFGDPCGVKSCCVYGGAKKGPQIRDLQRGVHLLVATPGRLMDLLESDVTNMRRITYLVLDEADRMLDMGFEPQIRAIVDQIRPDRQTVLWSATWPRDVEEIAAEFLTHPYKVTIGSEDLKANHNITQKFLMLRESEKIDQLENLLNAEGQRGRILVFCATKATADDVTKNLRNKGFGALCIHGDKEQAEREWVLEEFKGGTSPIMIATDVAQRGLDIKDVYCVVNYDLPNTGEDYVHRIGRTGRAGRRGLSISFFTERDAKIAKSILSVLEEARQDVPADLRRFAANVVRDPNFRYSQNNSFARTGGNAVPLHSGWRN